MFRVVHFEIPAENPEKSVEFYKNVFKWEINQWSSEMKYWLIKTGENSPGIDGAIYSPDGPFNGVVNTIDIPDIEEYLGIVKSYGGEVVTDIMPIPGVGRFAYCKDPGGVLFGIIQNDPNVTV